jgi:hypothetical protein
MAPGEVELVVTRSPAKSARKLVLGAHSTWEEIPKSGPILTGRFEGVAWGEVTTKGVGNLSGWAVMSEWLDGALDGMECSRLQMNSLPGYASADAVVTELESRGFQDCCD